MAIKETVVPAVPVRRPRDWRFPVRLVALLVVGPPLLLGAALLSAVMAAVDE